MCATSNSLTYVIDEVREWPVRQRQQLKKFPQAPFSSLPRFIICAHICNSEMGDKSVDETMVKILITAIKSEQIRGEKRVTCFCLQYYVICHWSLVFKNNEIFAILLIANILSLMLL